MAYIEPGSPWEKGYCESFNEAADEVLNGLLLDKRYQGACGAVASSLQHIRPHSSLGYRPPAPEAWGCKEQRDSFLRR